MIPIVVAAFGTVPNDLEKKRLALLKMRARIEITQTIAFLDILEYLENSWRPK